MSMRRAFEMVDAHGLGQWAEAEFQLRTAMALLHNSQLRQAMVTRCCQRLVHHLYHRRGATLPPFALCNAFDQLRGRRPFSAHQVHEARTLVDQLRALVTTTAPTREQQAKQLRRVVILANVVDGPGEDTGDSAAALTGPFTLPPGPFRTLLDDVTSLLHAGPPLLAALTILDSLSSHDGLFPQRTDVMALLLWPVLLTWAFGTPAPFIAPVQTGSVHASFDKAHTEAQMVASHLNDVDGWYFSSLRDAGHQRTGSRLPRVLQYVAQEPLFTAGGIAQSLGCVARTAEQQVARLENGGIITCMQQSGRLKIWQVRQSSFQL